MSKKKRHGRRPAAASAKPRQQSIEFVARPFAGLPAEEDLVAMAQIIPAATATVRLTKEYGGKQVQLVTLLPEFVQGLKRSDGEVLVAMQTSMHSGDASRDVAAAVLATLELPEGQALRADGLPEPGPRLQDILDTSEPPAVSVRETFDFWVDPQAGAGDAQVSARATVHHVTPTQTSGGGVSRQRVQRRHRLIALVLAQVRVDRGPLELGAALGVTLHHLLAPQLGGDLGLLGHQRDSLYSTCLRTTGSNLRSPSRSGVLRRFLRVT